MYGYQGYAENNPFIQLLRHEGSKLACDLVRRHRQWLMIEDIVNFAPGMGTKDRKLASAEGILATHSSPMISRSGELIGVLSNQFCQPHRPTDEQLCKIDLLAWAAVDLVKRHGGKRSPAAKRRMFRWLVETYAHAVWETNAAGEVVADSPS